MTVEVFFDNFLTEEINLKKLCDGECDGLNKDCDICKVTSRYKKLAGDLKDKLKILPTEDEELQPSTFLTGSYRRHTMIRPPKDVDFFVVLDSGEYQDSELGDLIIPKKLLNKLQKTLEEVFEGKNVEIKIQQHSVTVTFDDNFSLDVIPAFESQDKKSYLIPDVENNGDGKYIVSNPKTHHENINNINESTSVNGKKRFKRVVRLLKFIKDQRFNTGKTKIRSFHFELLAAKIIGSEKINSYSEGINNFLSEVSDYFGKSSITDPANSDNKVDDYIDNFSQETKDSIKGELDSLYGIAQDAATYEDAGNNDKAINEWKKIFEKQDIGNKGPTVIYSKPPQPWCSV